MRLWCLLLGTECIFHKPYKDTNGRKGFHLKNLGSGND